VTRLSPYISRGILSLQDIRDTAFDMAPPSEKFMQQLAWREYWHGILKLNPHYLWADAEDYKTGFEADDYADELPSDIAKAETGVACIDHVASNNLSWQWVASTFAHKPYYFNLDNVRKFSGDDIDTRFKTNRVLEGTYEALADRLFPNLEHKP